MKPQHTPSEWDIRYERDPFDSKQSTLRIIDLATIGHPQGPVTLATINVAAFAPHMEEPFANARLMAAAPALLTALKEATKRLAWHDSSEHGTYQDRRAVNSAYAAIAKAENKIIENE